MDAASELFLVDGFDRTSMDAIAARAGVSKTTVYAHYSDKLALFRAVVERGAAAFARRLEQLELEHGDGDAESRLVELLVEMLKTTTTPDFLALLRVTVIEGIRRPELAEVLHEPRVRDPAGLVDRVAALLQEDAARHNYTLSDARAFAGALVNFARASLQLECLLRVGLAPDAEMIHTHARLVLGLFLRGIRPRHDGEAIALPPPPDRAAWPLGRAPGSAR